MAYDAGLNKLFVVYTDGCDSSDRLMLATSADEGRSWTLATTIQVPQGIGRIENPSLAVVSDHVLALIWKNKPTSSRWFFSYIRDGALLGNTVSLTENSDKPAISNDSLWTEIIQPNRVGSDPDSPVQSSITLNVRTLLNAVWRSKGLITVDGKQEAIWTAGSNDGMRLYYGTLRNEGSASGKSVHVEGNEQDVTQDVLLLYGGNRDHVGQYFDESTGTLRIYAALRNLGHQPLRAPIRLRVEELSSPWGVISLLNSANDVAGTGAVFDISNSLTGNQIPPGSSSNPFVMSFRIKLDLADLPVIPVDLAKIKLKAFAQYLPRDPLPDNLGK
jgi:hypothetical protein